MDFPIFPSDFLHDFLLFWDGHPLKAWWIPILGPYKTLIIVFACCILLYARCIFIYTNIFMIICMYLYIYISLISVGYIYIYHISLLMHLFMVDRCSPFFWAIPHNSTEFTSRSGVRRYPLSGWRSLDKKT